MELIDPLMKWIVAPLAGLVAWIMKRINTMTTEMKVLEAKLKAETEFSANARAAIQQQTAQILAKLDKLEEYLRREK